MHNYLYKEYISDVIDRKITVCNLIYLAVKRHIEDIKKSENENYKYYFSEEEANRVISFIENLSHTKGEWAVKNNPKICLEAWQQFDIAMVFGWRDKETHLRRFKKAYIQIARKNGKTTILSGIGNYVFFCDSPLEAGAEIYYIATKKDQAKIAWSESERQVRKCKALNKIAITYKQTSTITKKTDTASRSKPLGKDSKTEDGLNPSFIGVDEYHAHPDNELLNVLESGTGARRQPLTFIITTAGFNKNSVCYKEYEYAKNVLKNIIEDEEYFTVVYEPDEEDIADLWSLYSESKNDKNKERIIDNIILKSNPNINISVKMDYVKRRLKEGLDKPYQRTDILTKTLNVWTEASSVWIAQEKWNNGNIKIDTDKLKGRKCYAGLDLSTTRDITAYVLCFPPNEELDKFIILPRFFMPSHNIRERSNEDKVPYELWASQGLITLTDGEIINFDKIEEAIFEDAKIYQIEEIAYDPWKATQIITHLQEKDFKTKDIRQNFSLGGISEGTALFSQAVYEDKLIHGGNPVLNWMISCTEVKNDGNENYRPVKPDRRKSTKRIDGIVASIMALHSAVRNENIDNSSAYESSGVLVL